MEYYKPALKPAPKVKRSRRPESRYQFFYSIGMLSPKRTDIVLETREGFTFNVFDRMLEHLEISQKDFLPIIGVSPATFARRRKVSEKLNADESDNLYRVANIFQDALNLFEGNEAAARNWIRTPAKALGNVPPLSLLDSQAGSDQVRDLIGRLDTGVYT